MQSHHTRRETFLPHVHLPHCSAHIKAPRVPIVVRSGLVRHEMCLVDVDYCKETRLALSPTVLIHYINPEVETELNLLSLSSPNPLCRIIYREAKTVEGVPPTRISKTQIQAGATSSVFRSEAEVEREMREMTEGLTAEEALEFADACVHTTEDDQTSD